MKYVKKSVFVVGFLLLLLAGSVSALSDIPILGWYEDYDSSDMQSYEFNLTDGTIWIEQPIYTDFLGQYFTMTNPDVWTTLSLTERGNVKNVEVYFEYYMPSYFGVCLGSLQYDGSDTWRSPQIVLLTNAESNLSSEGTFDDAFINLNSEIVCDEWRTFSHSVSDFANDWGSSFSGQSKTIGSIGFEMKNLYLRNIVVIGTEESIVVW